MNSYTLRSGRLLVLSCVLSGWQKWADKNFIFWWNMRNNIRDNLAFVIKVWMQNASLGTSHKKRLLKIWTFSNPAPNLSPYDILSPLCPHYELPVIMISTCYDKGNFTLSPDKPPAPALGRPSWTVPLSKWKVMLILVKHLRQVIGD